MADARAWHWRIRHTIRAMLITLPSTRLNVEQTGSGPALVLLHGFSDYGKNWLPLVPDLAKTHTVIMPDARGHGLSDRLATGFTLDDLAGDVIYLLDAMGIQQAALLGHSMGAGTAAHVAALHPERVARIVLEDPPWRAEHPQSAYQPDGWEAAVRAFQALSPDAQLAQARAQNPLWKDEEIPLWAESKAQFDMACFQAPLKVSWPDWRDDARAIRCPATLIIGDVSLGAIVSAGIAAEAERLCPTLRAVHIEGAGHCIRRERGEAFRSAVLRALN